MMQLTMRRGALAAFAAFAVSVAIACVGMLAFTAQAQAEEYFASFSNQMLDYNNNAVYGKPGDTIVLKPVLYKQSNYKKASGVTYKWKCSDALKATTTTTKATIKSLPAVGKYKVTMTAVNAKGKTIYTDTYKVIVQKKLSVKLITQNMKSNGTMTKNSASIKKNQEFFFTAKGANWGWDNNKKKPFYVWSAKNLKTGKSVTWSTDKALKSNSWIKGPKYGIGGADTPIATGKITKAGKYKITIKVYHSDKVAATASKTITVK